MQHSCYNPVYRPAHGEDCTNGGITSRYENLIVITDVPYKKIVHDGNKYFDRPDEDAVMAYVKEKKLDPKRVLILCDKFNNDAYTPYLKPLDAIYRTNKDGRPRLGPMAGGNYVLNVYDRMIRVHDRYETQEEYDTLSK